MAKAATINALLVSLKRKAWSVLKIPGNVQARCCRLCERSSCICGIYTSEQNTKTPQMRYFRYLVPNCQKPAKRASEPHKPGKAVKRLFSGIGK